MKTGRKPVVGVDAGSDPRQQAGSAPRMGRREFLSRSSAFALGMGLGSTLSTLADDVRYPAPSAAKLGWKVSVQGWTYRRFPLFEALDRAGEVGLRNFEVRTILKLDANRPGVNADENMPADARDELKARLADQGMSVPSVFADFNGKPDQAKRLLEFWRGLGTKVITAEPPKDSIDMLEKLFDEYEMQLAIHNHQRERSAYWSPEIVLEVCRNRGPHIGATCDGGQWARSGLDPVECLHKLEGRIYNFHLKDILTKGELFCRNTVIGEGQGSCAASLQELHRQGYKGIIVIDFEHDTPALQEDMAKNIAFIEERARQLLIQ